MPYKKQIADVERSLDEVQAEISLLRAAITQRRERDRQALDKLLISLAKLNAERRRLRERQLFSN